MQGLFILFMTPLLLLLICISSALLGGIAGWITGLFFGNTILGILSQIGIYNITMFQFGAFLGFVSSFFKTTISTKN